MMNMAMDMLKNNPDMIKNMGGMLGKDNPMAGMLKDAKPEDI